MAFDVVAPFYARRFFVRNVFVNMRNFSLVTCVEQAIAVYVHT